MFSCSLPYGMHSNPLPNAVFWAICLKSLWQADLMETLKWLPLNPPFNKGQWSVHKARPSNVEHTKWSKCRATSPLIGTESCCWHRASAWRPMCPSTAVCSMWELRWGLLLCRAAATKSCRRSFPQATATDSVQGILLIRYNGFAMHNTLERRLVLLEVLV